MRSQTRSELSECRQCGSSKTGSGLEAGFGYGYLVCFDCGELFMPLDEEEEVEAQLEKCPHCSSVDALVEHKGSWCCRVCGLEPQDLDYTGRELAHLWKSRTSEHEEGETLIREVMSSDPNKFKPNSNIGRFLRNYCGPHCSFAKHCPQTTTNFSRCYNEERSTRGDEMSKRRGKKRQKNKSERKAWKKLHSRAWIFVASNGWYTRQRHYASETHYNEQSEDTRG